MENKIQTTQNKTDNLENEIKRYEKEFKFFSNDTTNNITNKLKNKVSKWENNFQLPYENNNNNINLLSILNKYGSKQVHLILYIKQILNYKIMLFSLFSDTLNL